MFETAGTESQPRWWYLIATVPLVSLAGLALLYFYLQSATWVDPLINPYTYVLVIVLFLNPVAIYLDARALDRTGARWQPDAVIYVSAAVLGIMFPLISPLVAIIYLRNRFRE